MSIISKWTVNLFFCEISSISSLINFKFVDFFASQSSNVARKTSDQVEKIPENPLWTPMETIPCRFYSPAPMPALILAA